MKIALTDFVELQIDFIGLQMDLILDKIIFGI